MSTYKNLIGKEVRFVSSDLDNNAAEGQIWYNSTGNVFKNVAGASTWSSTGSLTTARRESGAAGTQTASVVFGGGLPPSGNPDTNVTEEYNGFNFYNSGNMNQAREGMGAAGTQTAALAFGGANYTTGGVLASNEEYGGSSWTTANAMNNTRSYVGGFGLQTAAIATGGGPGTAVTESYDGTNWTNLSSPSNAPGNLFLQAGCGTQTAGVIFGGKFLNDTPAPGPQAITLEWNGSSWTAAANLNQARMRLGGAGTQTAALGFGGYAGPPTFFNVTELYDGSSWTTSSGTLATATAHMHGSGTADAALSAGGRTSTAIVADSYEFNNTINVLTPATWSAGGNLGTARYGTLGAAGTQTAGLVFGGETPSTTANTEEYDGSSWSEQNNLPYAKQKNGGSGTQTAGLSFGGTPTPPSVNTEEYDGTNWTAGGSLGTGRYDINGAGTQTAGLAFGGLQDQDGTEEYDGSSWTGGGNMSNNRRNAARAGIQTAALAWAGPPSLNLMEEYNGSSWTAGPTLNDGVQNNGSDGTSTAALSFGGGDPGSQPFKSQTEAYNGTSWSITGSLGTGRYILSGAGPGFLAMGGANGGGVSNATEEFTEGSADALNVKTITTS